MSPGPDAWAVDPIVRTKVETASASVSHAVLLT